MATEKRGIAMTRKHLHVLLAVVVGLILTILIVENTDDSTPETRGLPLLPGFSEDANDAQQVRVVFRDAQAITIGRDGETWVIGARNDYPADVAQLRQLFVSLAEARIIEEKTSKPELYEKLGVDDPEDDGGGTKVYLEGDGFSYAVVLGNTVPGDRRYARLADVGISYLIDRKPATGCCPLSLISRRTVFKRYPSHMPMARRLPLKRVPET
jgi:hypothetical protein